MPELDLSNLVIGGVSVAPIIYLVVAGLKRTGRLNTPDKTIAVVVGLATLAYVVKLAAQAYPAVEPVLVALLQLGQALLGILAPAGASVLIHRASKAARQPASPNPYTDPPLPLPRSRGRG